jgi:DNA-binding transcriptional MerR regulator
VTALLKDYLDYLPPELKEEQFITAATINNYVRIKVMPEPVKRRYYRSHIAYLIIILTLKHSLSIALIQKLIPMGLAEEELKDLYTMYVSRHRKTAHYFIDQIRTVAGPILDHDDVAEDSIANTEDLIFCNAVAAGFTRLLAEKLLLLEGKDLESGGSVERSGNSGSRT